MDPAPHIPVLRGGREYVSLDTVELVMELEDEFDISIPDEEAEKIKTVGDAITHITAFMETKA